MSSFLSKLGANKPQTEPTSAAVAPSPQTEQPAGVAAVGLGALLARKRAEAQRGNESNQALAILPTSGTAEQTPSVPVVAARSEADFAAKMQRLDLTIGEIESISQLEIDHVRNLVVEIMLDLKQFPEFDGMVRAKDTRNLMKFIQATSSQVNNQFAKVAEKREVKKAKSGGLTVNLDAMAGFLPPPKTVTVSLDAFADMNFDDVPVKKK